MSGLPPSLQSLAGKLRLHHDMDGFSGVYFLCCQDEVVYIGQSTNIPARIGQHRGDKTFDRAYWMPVPAHRLDEVEGAMIRHYRPRLNISASGTPRAPAARNLDLTSREFGLVPLIGVDDSTREIGSGFIPLRDYRAPGRYPSSEHQLRHLYRNRFENGLAAAFVKIQGRVLFDPVRLTQLLSRLSPVNSGSPR